MKKFFATLITLAFSVFFMAPTLAIDLGIKDYAQPAAQKAGYDASHTTETSFAQSVGTAVKAVLSVVGVIFTALMVYAGFLWMNARGDDAEIEKSKNIIEAAVIGLVIALASYGVTTFVVNSILAKTTAPTP